MLIHRDEYSFQLGRGEIFIVLSLFVFLRKSGLHKQINHEKTSLNLGKEQKNIKQNVFYLQIL